MPHLSAHAIIPLLINGLIIPASIVLSIIHKEDVMDRKRKSLVAKGLAFLAIILLSLFTFPSCEIAKEPENNNDEKLFLYSGFVLESSSKTEETRPQTEEGEVYEISFMMEDAYKAPDQEEVKAEVVQVDSGNGEMVDVIVDLDIPQAIVTVVVEELGNTVVDVKQQITSIDGIEASKLDLPYGESLELRAKVAPENADRSDLVWSMQYPDDDSIDSDYSGITLIDNKDGSCLIVHNKVTSGFDLEVTASTKDGKTSGTCTIHCGGGGHGVLDYATDVFIQADEVSLPSTLEIPLYQKKTLDATVNLKEGETVSYYKWVVEGKDADCLVSGLLPFCSSGYVYAKYMVTHDTFIRLEVHLKSGTVLESNKCRIITTY